MSNTNQNIDDLFRGRLGDYSETPPPEIWKGLEQKLVTKKIPTGHFATHLFNYLILATTVVGITLFALYNYNKTSVSAAAQFTSEAPKQETENQTANTGSTGNVVTTRNTTLAQDNSGSASTNAVSDNEGSQASASDISKTASVATVQRGVSGASSDVKSNHDNTVGQASKVTSKKAVAYNQVHTHANRVFNAVEGILQNNNNHNLHGSVPDEPKTNRATSVLNSSTQVNAGIAGNGKPAGINDATTTASRDDAPTTAHLQAAPVKTFSDEQTTGSGNKESLAKVNVPGAGRNKYMGVTDKWEVWIHGGVEKSQSNLVYGTVIAPSVQYNVTGRMSIAVQPGMRTQVIDTRKIQGSQSFYSANNDGKATLSDSSFALIYSGGDSWDTGVFRNYKYTQTHDSIAKTYSTGGTYTSFELPITARYRLTKHFTIAGGVQVNFNALMHVNENTAIYRNVVQTGYDSTFALLHDAPPTPIAITKVLSYSGVPLSAYTGPLYKAPTGFLVNVGYNVGFSYDFLDRFRLDFSAQKSNAADNVVGGNNLYSAFSQWYFRMLIGCRLF